MDILTQATSSLRRRLIGFAAKDARFRGEVRHFAKALISELSDEERSEDALLEMPFSKSVIARCRLKSEATRWHAYRLTDQRGVTMSDTEWSLMRDELIEQGRDLHCHLWMLSQSFAVSDVDAMEELAGCYDTLAEAMELVNESATHIPNNRRVSEPLFKMLATIQSALRSAVIQVGGPEDQEQRVAFGWLKAKLEESRIFVSRHMKLDDPAEPESWVAVSEEIEAFRLLRRQEDKRQIVTEVHLISAPTTTGFAQFERVRNHILSVSKSAPTASSARPTRSNTVEAARKLLQGQSIVMIGGDERPNHRDAITEQFDLKELIWIPTNHGTPVKSFAPAVANDDVVVVLLAIRWASHSFGDVQVYCDRFGKPLVRLPGGYSPEQIAHQILTQCGDRLEAARSANDQ